MLFKHKDFSEKKIFNAVNIALHNYPTRKETSTTSEEFLQNLDAEESPYTKKIMIRINKQKSKSTKKKRSESSASTSRVVQNSSIQSGGSGGSNV